MQTGVDSLTITNAFLSGGIVLGYAFIAVSFQRFWRRSKIRLFKLFAVAFLLLAVERAVEVARFGHETSPQLYLLRLTAFALIIVAIVDHNRTETK